MDENKNLTNETEAEKAEVTETAFDDIIDRKSLKKAANNGNENKPKMIKNQQLFKKGGYSLAITAAVLAAIIIFNVLVSALGERFHLEFDMTQAKENSISQENIDYIKKIDNDISITVCANEDEYIGGYMSYYAQQYNISADATEYYAQTVKLVKNYEAYNDKIKVEFIDTQDQAFAAIAAKYPKDTINYGDIIVSGSVNGNERHKILGFTDIYELTQNTEYSSYGTIYIVGGNNVETALTGAIAYVTATETKKIGFITGHSATDYTLAYKQLLIDNNFVCEDITDSVITEISGDYDAIAIVAPTSDFIASEIDVISDYLDNDGILGKGLVFFGVSNAPYLTNFYDFLNQWGIEIGEGVLFETNSQNHIANNELAMGMYPTDSENDMTADMTICISGDNIPITTGFDADTNGMEVKELMATPDTVVAAPVGTAAGWKDYEDYNASAFVGAVEARKYDYGEKSEELSSYIYAFSSTDFIDSEYAESPSLANKDLVLAASEKAMKAEETGIKFISKVISNESYVHLITESSANAMKAIFEFVLPIIILAIGIIVYIKRRNA